MSPRGALVWIVLAAAALRVAAAGRDLWLDEVWGVLLVERIDSAWGVFRELRSTANHPLLSLWFLALPGDTPFWVYRLPSLVAGTASVALGAGLARRWGRREALLAALLLGGSHWLIFYASEARGYALMLCFALAAAALALRWLERGGGLALAGFWLACALGFLGHLVFALPYAALALWTPLALRAAGADLRRAARQTLLLHGPVLVFAATLALGFAVGMASPGGPPARLPESLLYTATVLLAGTPAQGVTAALCAAALAAIVARGLWLARRDPLAEGALYGLLLAVPVAFFALAPTDHPYARYLLPSGAFALLLAARVLGDALRRGRAARGAAWAALGFVVAANAAASADLVAARRGHYSRAIAYLERETPSATLRVGADHPVPTGMLLRFYARRFGTKHFAYVPPRAEEPPPDWVVTASYDRVEPRTPALRYLGARYEHAATFPRLTLSGASWFLYRRAAEPD